MSKSNKNIWARLRASLPSRKLLGLELRMTIAVVGMVALVYAVMMAVVINDVRSDYGTVLQNQLVRYSNATTREIELKLSGIEMAVKASAELIGTEIYNGDKVDSLLKRTIDKLYDVDGIAVAYSFDKRPKGDKLNVKHVYKRFADRSQFLFLDRIEDNYNYEYDENWRNSYVHDCDHWSVPFTEQLRNKYTMVCFSCPLKYEDRKTYGICMASMRLTEIEKIVLDLKSNSEVDVSIIARDGKPVVRQTDNIKRTSKENLLTIERNIDRAGWKVIFAIKRSVLENKIAAEVHKMLLMLLVTLVTIVVSIVLIVKYIARPFVRSQRLMVEHKAAIDKELSIAEQTQFTMVPHDIPDDKRVQIAHFLKPARNVGGDLYNYFIDNDTLYFCIGDVSGKGISASLFMAATVYLYRLSSKQCSDIAEATTYINSALSVDNERCMFVTFFFGKLNLNTGELQYCNAGHNSPILNDHFLPRAEGMPLGVFDEAEYETCTLQLNDGDTLLLYTDGVTEAKNGANKDLGDAETLTCAAARMHAEPKEIIAAVNDRIQQHAADTPQSDDITMLCLRWKK